MNTRIEAIKEKAKILAWNNGGGLISDKAFDVVAELIINECVMVARQAQRNHDDADWAIEDYFKDR
jgi:hypothetical protein